MMQIAYLFLAALGLGFLIFIHEMAHFLMARRVGMTVEAFSIGFGSPIYSWVKDGVQWRIGWIPFGGYVKIAGERKEGNVEPQDIPGGYLSKKPIDRIKVAAIAPIVNIVFAFIVFSAIWAMGGRVKTFHELTNRIGWIDPKSELYQAGIRPGDEITYFNSHKFHGFQEIFQATMLNKNGVRVQGYQYDYQAQTSKPFDLEVKPTADARSSLKGIVTTGIAPANYLLYDTPASQSAISASSPMSKSGIRYGDRVIWMDGKPIFSIAQFTALLNSNYSYITYDRQGVVGYAHVPRVKLGELKLSDDYKTELTDIKYESQLKEPLNTLWTIPYQISPSLKVEVPLRFLEQESTQVAMESSLKSGDRIIAIDGSPISNPQELVQKLQQHQFNIIVQSKNQDLPLISWQEANQTFDQNINWMELSQLASQIGQENAALEIGNLRRLNPVTPVRVQELYELSQNTALLSQIQAKRQEFEAIADLEKRQFLLDSLKQELNRLAVGVSFQDRPVIYNPPPYVLFAKVSSDIWHTLKALVTGGLSPKWLAGPIGIMQVMHQGWSLGFKEALYWLGLISLNLGILNLLPIPVLDGGLICFALWEMITKQPVKAKTIEKISIPFMILFIGFFIFVTFHDLSRLLKGIF